MSSRQSNLSSFFGKRSQDSDNESTPTKKRRIDNPSSAPSSPASSKAVTTPMKTKRTWRSDWENSFMWLRKREDNGEIRATCAWCIDAGKKNPYAREGSSNLQLSAFTRHEMNPEHLMVVEGRRVRQQQKTIPCVVDKIIDTESAVDESKTSQFRTLYFLAKNGLPLTQFNNIIELQKLNECPSLQDKTKLYSSSSLQGEMLDAINDTIEDNINANIQHSRFVGIILDETTDVTIHKKLNMYFQCLRVQDNEPVVHFIDCVAVHDGKAETLVNAIVSKCNELGLDCAKIINMASDGASVMTGKTNGVGARFRNDHSPRLLQVHCVAHRLALAAGQACKDVSLFDEFQRSLKLIYRYFHNSAIRYNQLRAVETLLQDDNMRCLSLKEPASFRWLSLEAAVTAILDTYPALLLTLDSDAAKGNTAGNAEAKGLYHRIRPVTFVLTTAFLKDVLSCVCKLSKVFQRDHVDIDTVNVMVDATLLKLESLKADNGRHLQDVYDALQQREGYYQDVKIQDRQSMRIQFQTEANKYLDKLCENIRDRFDQDSLGKLQMLNIILNPACLPSSLTAVSTHGREELKTLADFYGGENPLVDGMQLKDDYDQFKCVLKSLRGKSLKDSCVHIISNLQISMFLSKITGKKNNKKREVLKSAAGAGDQNYGKALEEMMKRIQSGRALTKVLKPVGGRRQQVIEEEDEVDQEPHSDKDEPHSDKDEPLSDKLESRSNIHPPKIAPSFESDEKPEAMVQLHSILNRFKRTQSESDITDQAFTDSDSDLARVFRKVKKSTTDETGPTDLMDRVKKEPQPEPVVVNKVPLRHVKQMSTVEEERNSVVEKDDLNEEDTVF